MEVLFCKWFDMKKINEMSFYDYLSTRMEPLDLPDSEYIFPGQKKTEVAYVKNMLVNLGALSPDEVGDVSSFDHNLLKAISEYRDYLNPKFIDNALLQKIQADFKLYSLFNPSGTRIEIVGSEFHRGKRKLYKTGQFIQNPHALSLPYYDRIGLPIVNVIFTSSVLDFDIKLKTKMKSLNFEKSAHFYISKNGNIFSGVNINKTAIAILNPIKEEKSDIKHNYLNEQSIVIELEHPGRIIRRDDKYIIEGSGIQYKREGISDNSLEIDSKNYCFWTDFSEKALESTYALVLLLKEIGYKFEHFLLASDICKDCFGPGKLFPLNKVEKVFSGEDFDSLDFKKNVPDEITLKSSSENILPQKHILDTDITLKTLKDFPFDSLNFKKNIPNEEED